MSRELVTAFVVFALASLFTPGPNNVMLVTLLIAFPALALWLPSVAFNK